MASQALAEGAACTPLPCDPVKAWPCAGREQRLWLGPPLTGLGEVTPVFTGVIPPPGLLGRERRGSRIFTHTLAKRPLLLTRVFASETWVGLGNAIREAAHIWRIMWTLRFGSLYFIFCFFTSFHRRPLKILEYLREVWSWFWCVFQSLLIRRHAVHTIGSKQ